MNNVIVLKGMNFSDSGFGSVVNTLIDVITTKQVGYINANGQLRNSNAIWNKRVNNSNYITIPSGTEAIAGVTNMIFPSEDNPIPAISYYDDNYNFISGTTALNEVIAQQDTTVDTISYQKGNLISIVPPTAKYMIAQWCTDEPSTQTAGDPDATVYFPDGPELYFVKG